jgi:hypothetical protein
MSAWFDYLDTMPDAECAAWAFGIIFVALLIRAMRNEMKWR